MKKKTMLCTGHNKERKKLIEEKEIEKKISTELVTNSFMTIIIKKKC